MNREKLTKIIARDIDELKDITDEFIQEGTATSLEVDIALSKAKLVVEELLLLKQSLAENNVLVQVEPEIIAKESEEKEVVDDSVQDEQTIQPEKESEVEVEPEPEPETEPEDEQEVREGPVVEMEDEPVIEPEPEPEPEIDDGRNRLQNWRLILNLKKMSPHQSG